MSPYAVNEASRYKRHGHKMSDQIRAEQIGLETEVATGSELAACPAQSAVSNPCRGTSGAKSEGANWPMGAVKIEAA